MNRIYATNKKDWENIVKKDYLEVKQLSVDILKNGILLPPRVKKNTNLEFEGGVCDEKFNFIAGLKRHEPKRTLSIEVNSSYKENNVLKSSEKIIFGGCLAGHFGHFVSEGLGRLWFLVQDDKYKNYKIAFLPYWGGEKTTWFKDFFKFLGIEDSRILMIKQATQFSEIIIPEESVHTWHSYTNEYLIPFKAICEKIAYMIPCKVYLTKKTWKGGAQLCNEEYFENFFRRKGFICIEPENYSVAEQIGLLYHATEVATTLGSLSHLALFCRPKTKFIILTRVNDDVLKPQALINQASGVDWYIVDVAKNYLYANRMVGINYIGPTKYFRDFIRDYFKEELLYDDENSTEKYIKRWCEYYKSPNNFKKISRLKSIDYFKRLYKIACGGELNFSELILGEENQKNYTDIYKWQIKEMSKETNDVVVDYDILVEIHLSNIGWIPPMNANIPLGDGKNFIEAIKVMLEPKTTADIVYSTYDIANGWGGEKNTGMVSGSTGKSRSLSGIRMRVAGEEDNIHIQYRCMYSNEGWGEWKSDGDEDYRVDKFMMGLQVKLKRTFFSHDSEVSNKLCK